MCWAKVSAVVICVGVIALMAGCGSYESVNHDDIQSLADVVYDQMAWLSAYIVALSNDLYALTSEDQPDQVALLADPIDGDTFYIALLEISELLGKPMPGEIVELSRRWRDGEAVPACGDALQTE